MDFAHLVGLARVIEDALGRSRFPGIDVGHDADIPIVFERCRSWHCVSFYPSSAFAAIRAAVYPSAAFPEIQTRVDRASLVSGTGIHPLSPGILATVARVGTEGAPVKAPALSFSALLFGKD